MRHIIIALALTACGPAPYSFDLDSPVIWDAADAWCDATDGACCPRPGEAPKVVLTTQASCLRMFDHGCRGWSASDEVGLAVDAIFNDETLLHVSLHEFGHWCGLRHNDDPASVMHPAGDATTLSPQDIALAIAQADRADD